MSKDCSDIITQESGKRGGRPCIRGMRVAMATIRAALAKGEADVAAGRITTLESDDEIEAFFARF